MVTMSALHSLTAELHAGFLTLAIVSILGVAFCQLIVGFQARLPKKLVNFAIKSRGYLEPAGYVGAFVGVIALVLSGWTGMNAWPHDALLESAVIRNKITLTIFGTVLWAMIVYMRIRFGRGLWTCPMMATLYAGLAVVAFGFVAAAGSMGAHLSPTVGESILDPLWDLFNINITEDLVLPSTIAGGIALICITLLFISLIVARKYKLLTVELTPETCQKATNIFKWDEPRLE